MLCTFAIVRLLTTIAWPGKKVSKWLLPGKYWESRVVIKKYSFNFRAPGYLFIYAILPGMFPFFRKY